MTLPDCNRIRRGLAISVTMVVLVGATMVQMAFTGSGSEPAAVDLVVTGPSELAYLPPEVSGRHSPLG